jgi:hypothetical protein
MISSTHASVAVPATLSGSSSPISPSSASTISPTASSVLFVVDTNGQNYTSFGCYSDSLERILAASTENNGQMTAEMCGKFCEGYKFFGVEDGDQCYCGDQVENGHGPIASTYCDYPCQGAPLELCGGSWALNLYEDEAFTLTTSSTTTSSSFTASMDPFSISTSTSQAVTISTSSVMAQSSSQLDSSSASSGLSATSTSPTSSKSSTTTTTTTATQRPNGCIHDNCLRAFISFSASASTYCATFTTAVVEGTATAGVPTWATACSYSASRLSTAYSCLASMTTSGMTSSTPA